MDKVIVDPPKRLDRQILMELTAPAFVLGFLGFLAGAELLVREHWTLAEFWPKAAFCLVMLVLITLIYTAISLRDLLFDLKSSIDRGQDVLSTRAMKRMGLLIVASPVINVSFIWLGKYFLKGTGWEHIPGYVFGAAAVGSLAVIPLLEVRDADRRMEQGEGGKATHIPISIIAFISRLLPTYLILVLSALALAGGLIAAMYYEGFLYVLPGALLATLLFVVAKLSVRTLVAQMDKIREIPNA